MCAALWGAAGGSGVSAVSCCYCRDGGGERVGGWGGGGGGGAGERITREAQGSGEPGRRRRRESACRAPPALQEVADASFGWIHASALALALVTIFSWMWLGTTSYFSSCKGRQAGGGDWGEGECGRARSTAGWRAACERHADARRGARHCAAAVQPLRHTQERQAAAQHAATAANCAVPRRALQPCQGAGAAPHHTGGGQHRRGVAHLHGVLCAALGHATQGGHVVEHLAEGHAGLDQLHAAGLVSEPGAQGGRSRRGGAQQPRLQSERTPPAAALQHRRSTSAAEAQLHSCNCGGSGLRRRAAAALTPAQCRAAS